jgi:hypothetical protein
VGGAGGDGAAAANGLAPIFEKFAVLEADVKRVGDESRSPDRVIPGGEEKRDVVLGNSREGDEFRTGGRATGAPGDGLQATEDTFLVELLFHNGFHIY